MTQTTIKKQLLNLEGQIKVLKNAFFMVPDFNVDEKNWNKVRPTLKKARKEIFQKTYGKK